jgi:hypothetical protein
MGGKKFLHTLSVQEMGRLYGKFHKNGSIHQIMLKNADV